MSTLLVKPIRRRGRQRSNDANKEISSTRNVVRVCKFKLHSGGTLKVSLLWLCQMCSEQFCLKVVCIVGVE